MADPYGRSLQDILGVGASSSSRPADGASPPGDVTTASESENMDYEATSDDASVDINNPEYLEAILRGAHQDYEEDNDDNDEDEEEDEGISKPLLPLSPPKLNRPSFRWTVW